MTGRVATFGEALAVLRTDPADPLWKAERLRVGTGGAEANVAMALARNGISVDWYGRVGDDGFGRRVERELRAEGVTVHARRDPENPTGLLVKEIHVGGGTAVTYFRAGSAGSRLSPEDIDGVALDADTLLHLTGITPGLSFPARAAVFHALDRSVEAGARVAFDINHRGSVWRTEDPAPVYQAIASRADVLFASLEEVPFLLRGSVFSTATDAAQALSTAGHRHVVVTAGAAGAVCCVDGALASVPAAPATVVDTVGAGDAFVGGYLARTLTGSSPAEALAYGALLGAAACQHPGDWEGAAAFEPRPAGDPVAR